MESESVFLMDEFLSKFVVNEVGLPRVNLTTMYIIFQYYCSIYMYEESVIGNKIEHF